MLPQLQALAIGGIRCRVGSVDGDDAPAAFVPADEDRRRLLAKRDAQVAEQHRHRIVLAGIGPDHVDEGLRLRPRPGSVGRASGGPGDEQADEPAGRHEGRHRDQVFGVLDPQRVEGLGEVPVGRSGRRECGDEGGAEPTDRRHDADVQQVDHQNRGQPDRVAGGVEHDGQKRQANHHQRPAGNPPTTRQPGPAATVSGRQRRPFYDAVAGDHVDVDLARSSDHAVDHRAPHQLGESIAVGGAEHDLGGAHRFGERNQPLGDVVAGRLVVGAAQVGEQRPVRKQRFVGALPQPGARADVHPDQVAVAASRHAGGPADQVVAARGAGDGHHHPLTRFPGAHDPLVAQVAPHGLVDLVGQP